MIMEAQAQAFQGVNELQAYLQVVMGFIEGHKEVTDKWSRYPHRKKVLGRSNRHKEDKANGSSIPHFWLKSSFAQSHRDSNQHYAECQNTKTAMCHPAEAVSAEHVLQALSSSDPGVFPGSANQGIPRRVYLRSNLSRKHSVSAA